MDAASQVEVAARSSSDAQTRHNTATTRSPMLTTSRAGSCKHRNVSQAHPPHRSQTIEPRTWLVGARRTRPAQDLQASEAPERRAAQEDEEANVDTMASMIPTQGKRQSPQAHKGLRRRKLAQESVAGQRRTRYAMLLYIMCVVFAFAWAPLCSPAELAPSGNSALASVLQAAGSRSSIVDGDDDDVGAASDTAEPDKGKSQGLLWVRERIELPPIPLSRVISGAVARISTCARQLPALRVGSRREMELDLAKLDEAQ